MEGFIQSLTCLRNRPFGRASQVISMSPEPKGHAKYPICSCEGSWAPDQTVGLDRVPISLDGRFLLSEPVNVFSRIPTFSCQRIRLKEPGIRNDRIRSVPPTGSDDRSQPSFPMMGSDDGSLGQISLIFSVIRNYRRNRLKESGVGNGRFPIYSVYRFL